jgi:hypothetical protein
MPPTYWYRLAAYPWIICSRTFSNPSCNSVTSTFFLHAFLPLREGCLCCCGAAMASVFGAMFVKKDLCQHLLLSVESSRRGCWNMCIKQQEKKDAAPWRGLACVERNFHSLRAASQGPQLPGPAARTTHRTSPARNRRETSSHFS